MKNKYVIQEIEAMTLLAKRHCKFYKGDVACSEIDVPLNQYCGPCYCGQILNKLKRRQLNEKD